MENLTKENVFIRVNTEKKARKLKKVFDIFGEKTMSKDAIELALEEYGSLRFSSGGWTSWYRGYGFTEVTIKQLKQILAKEKLKVGDYIVSKSNDVMKVSSLINELVIRCDCNDDDPEIDFALCHYNSFKRYATEEEIEDFNFERVIKHGHSTKDYSLNDISEALIKSKELEVGKWYHYTDFNDKTRKPIISLFSGVEEDANYGTDFNGDWCNDITLYNSKLGNEIRLATPQEVEEALTKEAKKRYKVGDCIECLSSLKDIGEVKFTAIKYYHEDCELWVGDPRNMICIFKNGKWAEVVKPEEKPKAGDVCKFWDNEESFYTISKLHSLTNDDFTPYVVVPGFSEYKNAKKLTQQEVNDLLFKN